MVVAALLATLLVNAIPGLAKIVLDWLADLGVEHDPSKYKVTVAGSEAEPKIVGVSELLGLAGVMDANDNVGAVVSIVTVLSIEVDAAFRLPNESVTVFAAIDGITVPETETAVAERAQVILSVVLRDHVIPDAVPF
jgi:hypothetical protein